MAIRVLAGALASAVALMLFGFVFWVFSPLPGMVMHGLPPDAEPILPALKQTLPVDGLYLYPFAYEAGGGDAAAWQVAQEDMARRHAEGPLLQIMFRRDGVDMMSPATYLQGFVQFFVTALLAGILLAKASRGLLCYRSRVGFVILAGLFAATMIDLASPIWFHHPWDYFLMLGFYHFAESLVIGLILAAVIKPLPTMPRGTGC